MKFSIITPSFRQLDYLQRCAASVADQTGSFEVSHLVQDGGSGPELEAWAATRRDIDLASEPDAGMYDAINRGFRRADGDILAWLNCDEQYLPGALDHVARWFNAHPAADIAIGDVIIVDPWGTPLSYRAAVRPRRGHVRNCFLPTFSAATFIRRKIIDDGHFLDTRFRAIADAVWIDTLLAKGYRCGTIRAALAAFTQTGGNLGQSALAEEERRRWKRECGIRGTTAARFWNACHRTGKLLRGAYLPRTVEVRLHDHGAGPRLTRSATVNEFWKTLDP